MNPLPLDPISKSSRSISEKRLDAFEKFIGGTLPSDYKNFMLKYNGGSPSDNWEWLDSDKFCPGLNYFYCMDDNPSAIKKLPLSIEKIYSDFHAVNDYPRHYVPFAQDRGGINYCISLSPKKFGAIFYCDPEYKSPEMVSLSFSKFLEAFQLGDKRNRSK